MVSGLRSLVLLARNFLWFNVCYFSKMQILFSIKLVQLEPLSQGELVWWNRSSSNVYVQCLYCLLFMANIVCDVYGSCLYCLMFMFNVRIVWCLWSSLYCLLYFPCFCCDMLLLILGPTFTALWSTAVVLNVLYEYIWIWFEVTLWRSQGVWLVETRGHESEV